MHENNNTKKLHVSIIGIVVSVVLFIFALLSTDCQQTETHHRTVLTPDVESLHKAMPVIIGLVSLTLFIRSFLPRLGFWRGVLTVVGSLLMFGIGSLVIFKFIIHEQPLGLAALVGTSLPCIIGGIMLVYGFKAKRGLRKQSK